jgi:hypothetical protein
MNSEVLVGLESRRRLLGRAVHLHLLLPQELLVLALNEVEVEERWHVVGVGRVEGT